MRLALFRPQPTPSRETLLTAIAEAATVAADRGAGLLVLPAGTWPPYGAEPADGPFAEGLAAIAARHRLALLAGLVEEAFGHRFDAVLVFGTDGLARGHYRRVHLRRDERGFAAGRWGLVAPLECGRSGILAGVDAWVPEYVRALVLSGAELLIGLDRTSPPALRAILAARAMENGRPVLWVSARGPAGLFTADGHEQPLDGAFAVFEVRAVAPPVVPAARHPLLYRAVCEDAGGRPVADPPA